MVKHALNTSSAMLAMVASRIQNGLMDQLVKSSETLACIVPWTKIAGLTTSAGTVLLKMLKVTKKRA